MTCKHKGRPAFVPVLHVYVMTKLGFQVVFVNSGYYEAVLYTV